MIHDAVMSGEYSALTFYGLLAGLVAVLIILSVIILKKSIRKREVPEIPGKRSHSEEVMILSIEKRGDTYHISLEPAAGVLHPVKLTRTITVSPEMRSETIARIEYTSKVINTLLSIQRKPRKAAGELEKMGTVIYKNFIPRDISQKLMHHYLVLEVEDVQIPWELMYSDQFFALKYAISRRIKSEKAPEIQIKRRKMKKILIIADPTETMPEALEECEHLATHLSPYFSVTYLPPRKARKVDVMYHLSQGYDIVHYAGEVENHMCLPVYQDVLTCEEIERTLEGFPIVFLNGCCSAKTFSYTIEGLAEVFLERGALSFIGSLWGIHDKRAAEIAAEFYKNCLWHPVGEALRLSRKKYYSPHDVTWAAFVMYGDPTVKIFR